MINVTRLTIAAAAAVGAALLLHPGDTEASPLVPQIEFPCAEDEVLGYGPGFGPDHVGCIHIDRLKES